METEPRITNPVVAQSISLEARTLGPTRTKLIELTITTEGVIQATAIDGSRYQAGEVRERHAAEEEYKQYGEALITDEAVEVTFRNERPAILFIPDFSQIWLMVD
jgi:hypothetical protein